MLTARWRAVLIWLTTCKILACSSSSGLAKNLAVTAATNAPKIKTVNTKSRLRISIPLLALPRITADKQRKCRNFSSAAANLPRLISLDIVCNSCNFTDDLVVSQSFPPYRQASNYSTALLNHEGSVLAVAYVTVVLLVYACVIMLMFASNIRKQNRMEADETDYYVEFMENKNRLMYLQQVGRTAKKISSVENGKAVALVDNKSARRVDVPVAAV